MNNETVQVLVVDDEPDIVESTQMLLSAEGISSAGAPTLQWARRRLLAGNVGCVLLDLHLPDAPASGAATVGALRAEFPQVPIVVVTGDPSSMEEVIDAGAQEVIVKPYDPARLLYQVRQAMVRHKTRAAWQPLLDHHDSAIRKLEDIKQQVDEVVKGEEGC